MKAYEVNFDGLVGPTHNYAGLSYGNIASMTHQAESSNPREAALQGLKKAKALADLGFQQGILPPQARPDPDVLRTLGFTGNDEQVLRSAFRSDPALLAAVSSASSMWTANAATVSPSADCKDGKVHITPANLIEKFHRAIETPTTSRILKATFKDPQYFTHHPALPGSMAFGDEGAANHTRFCRDYGEKGLEFFVYGRQALVSGATVAPQIFPARQTYEASQALARCHLLADDATVFGQQSPLSIDRGAFHNDVVSVGNRNVYFYHEMALLDSPRQIQRLTERFEKICGGRFYAIQVTEKEVPLDDAVKSYLFNSQIVSKSDDHMILIAPQECLETPSVARYLQKLIGESTTPLREVRHFDLRQSMHNGGGPACLRLRVVLTAAELQAVNKASLINESTYKVLVSWVEKYYRDRLMPADLADPQLLIENRTALDELTQILGMGSIYPFQTSRSA
jgi:succinylarginine dihydrolase